MRLGARGTRAPDASGPSRRAGAACAHRTCASRTCASRTCASRTCASRTCASRTCASRTCASRTCAHRTCAHRTCAHRTCAHRTCASRTCAHRTCASRTPGGRGRPWAKHGRGAQEPVVDRPMDGEEPPSTRCMRPRPGPGSPVASAHACDVATGSSQRSRTATWSGWTPPVRLAGPLLTGWAHHPREVPCPRRPSARLAPNPAPRNRPRHRPRHRPDPDQHPDQHQDQHPDQHPRHPAPPRAPR
jgi:hypothetical protein